MNYHAEGVLRFPEGYGSDALRRAMENGTILESRAQSFGTDRALHFFLGSCAGVMPYEECADGVREGTVRDIALLTRVGRPVCFVVTALYTDANGRPVAALSRALAQKRCKENYLAQLAPGDVIPCRVTHIEPFGAFCDVGCGISALLPIDCMSVSRIASPSDRVEVGQALRCVVKSRDSAGRLVLSLKELLGTWQQNADCFRAGETVVGIVRSVAAYGVFIELAPNLTGLAEPTPGLCQGQAVQVYIKSILAPRMKVKLAVVGTVEPYGFRFPLHYFVQEPHIAHWRYSASDSPRCIETFFDSAAP
jgi:small subunit ribosomal protein S1